jgi:hypothetical protein
MRVLFDRQIYDEFTQDCLLKAEDFVWIATANIKSTGLKYGGKFISFVELMMIQLNQGVSYRIIHSELPSKPFLEAYDKWDAHGHLSSGVEFLHCIRMHSKIFIVDGQVALVGSANLTGAGVGAKGENNRNFETAILFDGQSEVEPFMNYFDYIWMGGCCRRCGRRKLCPAPVG